MKNFTDYLQVFDSIELQNILSSGSSGSYFTPVTNSLGKILLNYSQSSVTGSCIFIPLINYTYDETKAMSLYGITSSITNITSQSINSSSVSTSVDFRSLYLQTLNQKTNLETQLNTIVSQSIDTSALSDVSAAKSVIENLRIQLSQGVSSSDFSDIFPYLPITNNR